MITTHELAHLLEQSEINYMVDRMTAIKERDGNPEGVEIARFGECVAFYSRTMPWGLFNNVKGRIEPEYVDDIIDFYRSRDRKFEFQMIPGKVNQEVLMLLHDRGFCQSGFHTTTYCTPRKIEPEEHAPIQIRELRPDEFDTYAEIHCLGTGLPLDGKPYVAMNNKVLYSRPGWHYYIGLYDDTPAAVAVMHIQDGLASLTFATTLPEYRNKGLQTRLLHRRIRDAFMHDCRLVVGQCAYGSTSHRNMERAGMKIGYTRAAWTQR